VCGCALSSSISIASLSELCTSALCVPPDIDLCIPPDIDLCISPDIELCISPVFFIGLELIPDLVPGEVRVAASLPLAQLPKILIRRVPSGSMHVINTAQQEVPRVTRD
jgi:hypothetical protein